MSSRQDFSSCDVFAELGNAPDFGEGFPGLPVVEADEQEAGEGADECHQQRHHGHAAGRAQVGDAAGTKQPLVHCDLLLVSLLCR